MNSDLSKAKWRKSSHSFHNGECVEVASNLPNVVAVRDSKRPHAAALVLPTEAFRALVRETTR